MSSGTTQRHLGLYGNEDIPAVRTGNICAARFALLAMVCAVLGIFWCESRRDVARCQL